MMPNITLSIPEDVKHKMDELKEVNWSELTRRFIAERAQRLLLLKKLDKMLEHSELTDEDIMELSRKARAGRFDELKKQGVI